MTFRQTHKLSILLAIAFVLPGPNLVGQQEDSLKPTITMVQVPISDTATAPVSTRYASFMLGKHLALVGNLKLRGQSKEAFQDSVLKFERLAKGLNVELPEFPDLKGFRDSGKLNKYLLDGDDSVYVAVKQAQSQECGELFKLSACGILAGMMYHEGTEGVPMNEMQEAMNAYVIDGIARSSFRANFESRDQVLAAASPLATWMNQKKPSGDGMREVYLGFFKELESLLKSEFMSPEESSLVAEAVRPGQVVMVEVVLPNGKPQLLSRRLATSKLGKELGMALSLRLNGVERSKLEDTLKSINSLAFALDLELNEPPKIEGVSDVWAVMKYLHDTEDSVKSSIVKRHTAACGELFELSSIAMLSPVLYRGAKEGTPLSDAKKAINQLLIKALNRSALGSNFATDQEKNDATGTVINWIKASKPAGPEFIAIVKEMNAKTNAALLKEIEVANGSGKLVKFKTRTSPSSGVSSSLRKPAPAGATKANLILTVRNLHRELVNKDYEAASEFLVVPPGANLEGLAGLSRELSEAGIDKLEAEAMFQHAIDAFGKKRATAFADKMGANVNDCYGCNHSVGDQTAELIGQWADGKFKLVRVDDIANIAVSEASGNEWSDKDDGRSVEDAKSDVDKEKGESKSIEPKPNRETLMQRVSELSQVVEADPNDIESRVMYATALSLAKSYPSAWEQFSIAYKANPSHPAVVRGIDSVMGGFTSMGVFSIGVPAETIEGLMGEPNQVLDIAIGKRQVFAHWAIDFKDGRVSRLIDLRGATEALFDSPKSIHTKLDGRNWMTGLRKFQHPKTTVMMFIPGQTIANYSERITLECFLGVSKWGTIDKIAEKVIADEKKRIPNASHKILEQDETSLIMAVKWGADEHVGKDEHMLVKLFKGPNDLHRLTYTIKSDEEPSRETQMKWLGIFQKASLLDN